LLGDSVPRPLGFIALMPIPANKSCCRGSAFTEPQPGLGPGVDAQVASQQSPILRSGRLQCIATPSSRASQFFGAALLNGVGVVMILDFKGYPPSACFTVDVTVLKAHPVCEAARCAISAITRLLFASIRSRSSYSCAGCMWGINRASAASSAAMQAGKVSLRDRKRRITSLVSRS